MNRHLQRGYWSIVLLGIVCPAVAFAGDALQSPDCRLKQLASIDLDIGVNVLMPVTIDGTPARMGLTTASCVSSISKQAVDEMGLVIAKAPASLLGTLGIATINSTGQ